MPGKRMRVLAGCVALGALAAPSVAQAQYTAPPPDAGFHYIFDGTATGSDASFDKWKFASGTEAQSQTQGRATLDKPAIKVLLNLALIAGDALVRGGRLDIGAENVGGTTEMVVKAEGPRLVLDPELRQALEGRTAAADVTPRAAAAWMVSELVRAANGTIQVSAPDDPFVMFGAVMHAG